MLNSSSLVSQMTLKIDNKVPNYMQSAEIIVDTSVLQPAVATITIHDPGPHLVDRHSLIGKSLTVEAKQHILFNGDIVEIGMDFANAKPQLVIVAFDRLHLLARGTQTRLFNNVSFSDVAKKLAQEAGLTGGAKVEGVDQSYDCVTQNNETNLAFLRRLAIPLGCLIYVRGKTLHCKLPPEVTSGSPMGGLIGSAVGAVAGALGVNLGSSLDLKWGTNLKEFYPRLTTIGQLNSVTVRGWDPDKQQEVIGKAESGQGSPQIGQTSKGTPGGELAKQAFGIKAEMVVPSSFHDQSYADDLAQAVLNHHEGQFITAEGSCIGEPGLIAGKTVKISLVSSRFSGTYFVTSTRHVYHQTYTTQFTVSLYDPLTLVHMLGSGKEERPTAPPGIAIAVVTNNDDPNNAGRVKLKFPWLSPDYESDWVRVLAPGGGDGRGMQFHPIVNQEVMVAFELGNIERPYVLGALWSENCKLPEPKHSENGKVTTCVIASTNHTITFDDKQGDEDDQGEVKIEDKKGNTIILKASKDDGGITITDMKGNSITLSGGSTPGITIESKGDLTLNASGKVTIKGGKDVTIKGTQISLN
jgi:uncharacterized protein involved in type VI secretion and phage assembly